MTSRKEEAIYEAEDKRDECKSNSKIEVRIR